MSVPSARVRIILRLALPIVLVLLAQNLMGLISLAMVSRLGDAAVAGVGIANALFSTVMAVLFGIDAGVQALVARRLGAGQLRQAGVVLTESLAIAVAGGSFLAALGYVAGPLLLPLITPDTAVVACALPYLQAVLPMLPVLGANFAFGAYRNGAGTPRHSLVAIAVQLPCGILLSYLLIFGEFGLPRLETAGAGLGATLAAVVALAAHLLLTTRIAPVPGVFSTWPSRSGMRLILKIGLPVGIQQALAFLGSAIYLAIVGRLGTAELAAMNVVLTLLLLPILAASGVGIAAATLVGTALGGGDARDARRSGWEAARLGSLGILALGLIVTAVPRSTLNLLIADQATIDLAVVPLGVLAVGMSIDAFGRILGFALRGAGETRLVASVAFMMQWGAQLPFAWLVAIQLGFGLTGMAICRLLLFAAETAIVTIMWRNGFWSRVHQINVS